MVGLRNCDPPKLRLISRFRREIELHDSACRRIAQTRESIEAEAELENGAGLGRKSRVQNGLIVGRCALRSRPYRDSFARDWKWIAGKPEGLLLSYRSWCRATSRITYK